MTEGVVNGFAKTIREFEMVQKILGFIADSFLFWEIMPIASTIAMKDAGEIVYWRVRDWEFNIDEKDEWDGEK